MLHGGLQKTHLLGESNAPPRIAISPSEDPSRFLSPGRIKFKDSGTFTERHFALSDSFKSAWVKHDLLVAGDRNK